MEKEVEGQEGMIVVGADAEAGGARRWMGLTKKQEHQGAMLTVP